MSAKKLVSGGSFSHRHQSTPENVIRSFEFGETPKKYFSGPSPEALLQLKENFLQHNKPPDFNKLHCAKTTKCANKARGQVRFTYLPLARSVLEKVYKEFGNGNCYLNSTYGSIISKERATKLLRKYFSRGNKVLNKIDVVWSKDINSSAVMISRGPSNRPDKRQYTLVIKDEASMPYMRQRGVLGLADHEVGTHFMRFFNDSLQPWCLERQKFRLRSRKCLLALESEEGLAALNTLSRAHYHYLYKSALLYYTACMSTIMDFKELFDHLSGLEPDPDTRWKLVFRVKRTMAGDDVGGFGKDQCYFAGAVKILQNLDSINLKLLYSGKICYDETPIIKRVARTGGILYPDFIENEPAYRRHLKRLARLNGIVKNITMCALECPTIKTLAAIHKSSSDSLSRTPAEEQDNGAETASEADSGKGESPVSQNDNEDGDDDDEDDDDDDEDDDECSNISERDNRKGGHASAGILGERSLGLESPTKTLPPKAHKVVVSVSEKQAESACPTAGFVESEGNQLEEPAPIQAFPCSLRIKSMFKAKWRREESKKTEAKRYLWISKQTAPIGAGKAKDHITSSPTNPNNLSLPDNPARVVPSNQIEAQVPPQADGKLESEVRPESTTLESPVPIPLWEKNDCSWMDCISPPPPSSPDPPWELCSGVEQQDINSTKPPNPGMRKSKWGKHSTKIHLTQSTGSGMADVCGVGGGYPENSGRPSLSHRVKRDLAKEFCAYEKWKMADVEDEEGERDCTTLPSYLFYRISNKLRSNSPPSSESCLQQPPPSKRASHSQRLRQEQRRSYVPPTATVLCQTADETSQKSVRDETFYIKNMISSSFRRRYGHPAKASSHDSKLPNL